MEDLQGNKILAIAYWSADIYPGNGKKTEVGKPAAVYTDNATYDFDWSDRLQGLYFHESGAGIRVFSEIGHDGGQFLWIEPEYFTNIPSPCFYQRGQKQLLKHKRNPFDQAIEDGTVNCQITGSIWPYSHLSPFVVETRDFAGFGGIGSEDESLKTISQQLLTYLSEKSVRPSELISALKSGSYHFTEVPENIFDSRQRYDSVNDLGSFPMIKKLGEEKDSPAKLNIGNRTLTLDHEYFRNEEFADLTRILISLDAADEWRATPEFKGFIQKLDKEFAKRFN